MAFTGRALHYVLKIGNRGASAKFFRDILGMQVLRHEEFKEGCDAQCNGPYDNRWSKTMVGYGPESSHFVLELTYNYGVSHYILGNDFLGVTIQSKDIIKRAIKEEYEMTQELGSTVLLSPDGYKFYIIDEDQPTDSDPVKEIALFCTNMNVTKKYWHDTLHMKIQEDTAETITFSYPDDSTKLRFKILCGKINHAAGYGRLAFAVARDLQPVIDEIIKRNNYNILTPLIELDTPGKATVRVIILADPDGHEICFVDEEGFAKLSEVENGASDELDKYIGKDPFQPSLVKED